ncbi:MAG: hypothetical protein JW953_01495 [Anaerolineae bacterium]|nr:hypothetical protein [Anaerolineae bacterium]
MADGKIIQAQRRVIRLEDETAKLVIEAYERARREMTGILLERFQQLGDNPNTEAIRELARDAGLLREIEQQLVELTGQHANIMRAGLSESQQLGLQIAERELERLATRLKINVAPFTGIDRRLPILLDAIMRQVEGISEQYRRTLTSELLTSLARGDSFRTMVQRLLAAEPTPDGVSLARQGKNAAELLARKTVIEANNASRQSVYEEARQNIDGLKKQLVAVIQERTTETCLKAHGQIRELEEPYVLTGKPRFAKKIMFPPFHWRCRSSSVAYHPSFEEGSKMTTAAMTEAAKAELKRRDAEKSKK